MAVPDPTTIVAIATPRGRGALGLVRLSGREALPIGRAVFRAVPPLGVSGRVRRGHIIGPNDHAVDDALAWFLRGPGTYTGDDTVEISTHGSPALLELLVETSCRQGARRAEPGEFTRRAFLNGRLDLVQAEAVADLIGAQSVGGFEVAYGALSGALSGRLRTLREAIVEGLAFIEAGLDFNDEVTDSDLAGVASRLDAVRAAAHRLVETFSGSRKRLEGFRVAIVGTPNAGKSTLLNRLLGEDRALVHEAPGTTRDWLEVQVVWSGEIVHLVDTAGLRDTRDPVEAGGVERAQAQMAAADVAICLVDGSCPGPATPTWGGVRGASVVAINKSDLPRRAVLPPDVDSVALSVSALSGLGLDALRREVLARLPRDTHDEGIGLLRERHREGLQVVEEAVEGASVELASGRWETAAEELNRARRSICGILGEDVDDAVLERIFSSFCVGK